MGKRRPRRGSMGVWPRKRAGRIVARIRSWPTIVSDKPRMLGFAGYKVGMVHVLMTEDRSNSPFFGRQVIKSATVIETPPLLVVGFRAYSKDVGGLKAIGEVWLPKPPEDLKRVFTVPEEYDQEKQIKKIEARLGEIVEFRAIVATQPRKAGIHKKKPEIFEIKIDGGDIKEQFEYLRGLVGKEVRIGEVFEEGDYVDAVSITKGKGTQGPVKRFGVKELPRWHKHRKGSRKIGARSPGIGTISEAPQPGQLGYHRRTEYNKRIILMESDGYTITPSGGFPHYGIVRSHFIGVLGSVMGPPKRPLVLRHPIRPPEWRPTSAPEIVYLSLASKQ